jgi:uncharacterized protein YkwD
MKFTKLLQPCLFAFALMALFSCGQNSQADSSQSLFSQPALDPNVASMVNTAVARANEIRQQNGLPALALDAGITMAAQNHASDMETKNYFEHEGLDGRSPFDRMHDSGVSFTAAAENIAHGQRSAVSAFAAWLSSPGHRKNLLNPRYHRQGLGWANGYWVHDFAD